jgi:hypothetical protein
MSDMHRKRRRARAEAEGARLLKLRPERAAERATADQNARAGFRSANGTGFATLKLVAAVLD